MTGHENEFILYNTCMPLFLPKNHGVLGINARNLKYLRPFNPRKAVAFADDKLKTKAFLEARGIPVPKLYAKISSRDALRAFNFDSLPDSFALKPNFGYGGEGILVMHSRDRGGFKTASGKHLSYWELFEHCEDILDGMYSLNHRRDTAFFEQLIIADNCFHPLNPAGLPDIRIIVHNLVPVMAMMRLPTEESDGKANLHLGGVGLGIDMAKGITTFGVKKNQQIKALPNGVEAAGFKIPYWDDMLLISSRIQQITNIGFLGVDLTIDKDSGPLLLEVNARAGLAVQTANLAPLGKRLERIEGLKVGTPEKGVRMSQDLFGEKVESKKEKSSDEKQKPVLATKEYIEILGGKKPLTVPAVLRPDHDRTVFDPSLIKELKKLGALEEGEGGTFRAKFVLGGKKLQTIVHAHEISEGGGIRASIGKRDLSGFLVDPGKTSSEKIGVTVDLKRIDKQLADIDRKMQILKHIRPVNLAEERQKAERDSSYNPVFTYSDLSFDSSELRDRLRYLSADSSPLGLLLGKKRQELVHKIDLLEARGDNNTFTRASEILFGASTPSLAKDARSLLQTWKKVRTGEEERMVTAEEVQEVFQTVLSEYGLRDWNVRIKANAISDCSLGRKALLIRAGAEFTEERVRSLIAHEIETHVLTSVNGEKQPYELFERGCAGYLETQEGLAVYNQNLVLSEDNEKRFWPAVGTLAVHYGATHSFAKLRAYIRRLGFSDARALRTCFKVKRGMSDTSQSGAFTKEIVYFRGWKLVSDYLQSGGDLKELYKGKVNVRDIELIREVKELIDPVYLPKG
jgi:alpha-L-glutamate ligase-like protein/uncharacterized protein (TIGR02421 family)